MPCYLKEDVGVEWERGDQIDDVDGRSGENELVGADHDANSELEREPHVAHLITPTFLRFIIIGAHTWIRIKITNSTKKKAWWGSVLVLSSVQPAVQLPIIGRPCLFRKPSAGPVQSTVTFRMTGTRKFGCVLRQNERIETQIKKTDTSPTICKENCVHKIKLLCMCRSCYRTAITAADDLTGVVNIYGRATYWGWDVQAQHIHALYYHRLVTKVRISNNF